MVIRTLTTQDLEILDAFYAALSPAVLEMFDPFEGPVSAERLRTLLEESAAGQHLDLGLLDDSGRMVGHSFVWHLGAEKPFFGIGLMECAQGQGEGRRIMEAVLAECDARGLPLVTLTVLKCNTRAKALYDTLGFAVAGEVSFRGPNDSWYMERRRAGEEG